MDQLKELITPIFEEVIRKVIKEEIPQHLNTIISGSKKNDIPQAYYSKKEAAEYLRCSVASIDNYVRGGKLQRFRNGGKALFQKDDLDQMVLRSSRR